MFWSKILYIAAACGLVLWSYWPEFSILAERWALEEEYTHGWLVPAFAVILLVLRRKELKDADQPGGEKPLWLPGGLLAVGVLLWLSGSTPYTLSAGGWIGLACSVAGFSWLFAQLVRPYLAQVSVSTRLLGVAMMLVAGVMRLLAAVYNTEWIDQLSLLPLLGGLVLAVTGTQAFMWTVPSIAYLIFMIPLPYRLETALRQPLRAFATASSTYLLQTFGLPAYSEGNIVMVNDVRLDIVEACSGLSMLMIFFALSVAVAILSDRPLWQRLVIVLSAIPIALASNVFRILTQGLLHIYKLDSWAEWFHDHGAAWVMMGFALLILGFELWYLDKLFIVEFKTPLNFGMGERDEANLQSGAAVTGSARG